MIGMNMESSSPGQSVSYDSVQITMQCAEDSVIFSDFQQLSSSAKFILHTVNHKTGSHSLTQKDGITLTDELFYTAATVRNYIPVELAAF